ncbi:MAG: GNAT family N-acetyltransferase [Bacteroidota bacterium]|nr:GNAT family N-acetyltransferase [Bacteroidota bacterium]
MIFETERLYVTKWKAGDLESLYDLFNDVAIKEFILPALTIEETAHILEEQLYNYDLNFPFGRYFIIEKYSNDFIGLFLFKENRDEAGVEIGYSLIKEQWNKGYATEIVEKSIFWLSTQKRFSTIYAVTETDNINSKHVLSKCGFIQENNFVEDGKEMNLFGFEGLKKHRLV